MEAIQQVLSLTPAQRWAMQMMAAHPGTYQPGQPGVLWRWPGGFWHWTSYRPGQDLPRDVIAGRTVKALMDKRLVMGVRFGRGGKPYMVGVTQPGREVLAHLAPGPYANPKNGGEMQTVLVTTQYRGVFAGEIEDGQDLEARSMPLKNARMAIRWGTRRGVMELAATGPTERSRISAPADIPMLHEITAVIAITPEAWAKWLSV